MEKWLVITDETEEQVWIWNKYPENGNHDKRGGERMEIIRDDQTKMVQVWMTNQERQDTTLQRQMKPMYAQWKRENFLVAVFQSGPRELQASTRDLLSYNKKRIAQMEVAHNKGRKCVVQE